MTRQDSSGSMTLPRQGLGSRSRLTPDEGQDRRHTTSTSLFDISNSDLRQDESYKQQLKQLQQQDLQQPQQQHSILRQKLGPHLQLQHQQQQLQRNNNITSKQHFQQENNCFRDCNNRTPDQQHKQQQHCRLQSPLLSNSPQNEQASSYRPDESTKPHHQKLPYIHHQEQLNQQQQQTHQQKHHLQHQERADRIQGALTSYIVLDACPPEFQNDSRSSIDVPDPPPPPRITAHILHHQPTSTTSSSSSSAVSSQLQQVMTNSYHLPRHTPSPPHTSTIHQHHRTSRPHLEKRVTILEEGVHRL